jgi:hypothetical protein
VFLVEAAYADGEAVGVPIEMARSDLCVAAGASEALAVVVVIAA